MTPELKSALAPFVAFVEAIQTRSHFAVIRDSNVETYVIDIKGVHHELTIGDMRRLVSAYRNALGLEGMAVERAPSPTLPVPPSQKSSGPPEPLPLRSQ